MPSATHEFRELAAPIAAPRGDVRILDLPGGADRLATQGEVRPAREPRPATPYIPSLDGIRAVSFMIVFLAHAGVVGVPGGFGVTVFFYLSGFLITTLMRIEVEKTGTVHLGHFYLRRALRILPPFYLILAFACIITWAGILPGDLKTAGVLAQSLHISNYWLIWQGADGVAVGTAPYWSLAVEEHFYLVFPLLYVWLTRTLSRPRQAGVLIAICALVLAWRCVLIGWVGVMDGRTYMGSDTRADSIFFGSALALGLNPMLDRPRGSAGFWKWMLFPLGLAVLVFTFVYRDPWFRETVRYTLQGIALTPVFVAAIRFPEWLPFRVLNLRSVSFVGVLSYSLYLVHQVMLYLLGYQLPAVSDFTRGCLALFLSFVVSLAIYYVVEQPLARVRKRLARRALASS